MDTNLKVDFSIQTENYEGPFELALDLVEQRKLLVNDLALAAITDDFIAHVRAQDTFPVEQTAHFVQIAATLLLIKSKSLIPDLTLTEEEQEDVAQLTQRLEQYERYRSVARVLRDTWGNAYLVPAPARAAEPFFAPTRDLTIETLRTALEHVLETRGTEEQLPEARVRSMVSLEETMSRLAERVQSAMSISFRHFAGSSTEKHSIIVSFLALLELVKQGSVTADQDELHGDITVAHADAQRLPRYS